MAALSRESPTLSGDGGNDTIICGDSGDDRANGDNLALNGLASGDGGDDTIIGAEGSVGDNNGITTAGGGGEDSITGTAEAMRR